jgi:hypothetical protein
MVVIVVFTEGKKSNIVPFQIKQDEKTSHGALASQPN